MGFLHAMTCQTEGINSTAPVRWRSFDAICGVFWEAEGRAGATGYYRSPDPRLMLFFNDVADQIVVSRRGAVTRDDPRPLLRAVYVPAGMPMWTRFRTDHRFSHLDLHLRQAWLLDRLAPSLGQADAANAVLRPSEIQDVSAIAAIGLALRDEIVTAAHHPLFAENLAAALVTGLLDLPQHAAAVAPASGGLTPAQMRRLTRLVDEDAGQRRSNAELAESVGLSTSWFAQAFKSTTGTTPLQWQQKRRIDRVKQALLSERAPIADIATQFGFADQAHLTRVFRGHEGTPPAAWLRAQRKA